MGNGGKLLIMGISRANFVVIVVAVPRCLEANIGRCSFARTLSSAI